MKHETALAKILISVAAIAAFALLAGCAGMTNNASTLQTTVGSYTEGGSEREKHNDYMQITVNVLWRKVPEKGAIARFTDHLGNFIQDLNISSAVVAWGTQPERIFAKLETGTRAHLSIPIRVPVYRDRETTVKVTTNDIREAAVKALKKSELQDVVDGVTVSDITVTARVGGPQTDAAE